MTLRFKIGDRVRKHSGTWWEGKVVGFYSTAKNPKGYSVQMDQVENGPVQIYPEAALELVKKGKIGALLDGPQELYQKQVGIWLVEAFGSEVAINRLERAHRFLEEALELAQSLSCTRHEARQLVDYVFGREIGDPSQEIGGVMVTLAALSHANGLDMEAAGKAELDRCWKNIDLIRAKQAAKPKMSPLPGKSPPPKDW